MQKDWDVDNKNVVILQRWKNFSCLWFWVVLGWFLGEML